tara:strand:- start:3269 stop:3415 length:147 start_codon:yes stop_codon:yes gene_type:complete
MVDERKFDELVANTTQYLTGILKRLDALEQRVEKLETPPAKKGKKDGQ